METGNRAPRLRVLLKNFRISLTFKRFAGPPHRLICCFKILKRKQNQNKTGPTVTITLWLIFNGKTVMRNFIFLGRLGTLLLLVLNQAVYFYIPGVWMEPAVQVASGVFFTLWTNRILYNFLDIITLCLEAYERISLTSFREQTVTRIYKVFSHLNVAISKIILSCWFVAIDSLLIFFFPYILQL